MSDCNDKRWLVTLLTSNKIVAPALREIIQNGMEELYTTLDDRLPKSYSLKTLTYEDVRHLAVTLSPWLKDLHFENINNNSDVKGENKKTRYNYNVNSSVDLAKLYLPDYLAEFSAFDESMDLSASLRLLGCRKYPKQIFVSSDPSHNIQELADDVRKNVRNKGAHFKEKDWTPIFFDQCFDMLKALLQCLPLLPDEKKKELSDQLSTWKTEVLGFKLIGYHDVQELREKFLKVEFASIHEILDDMPTKEEKERVIKTLWNISIEMMDGFGKLERLLQTVVKTFNRSSVLYTDATSNETHQVREKVEPVRGHSARCDKPLKVTLLASEWNSSREGLSTINRHLAILMAKRSEVKVTLLVPQSACSEEEKRAAEIDKIVIKEAERREGVDPLDWLSSPPEDLKIDVVMGHGAKLGEQAQSIRASHSCLWVQVVYTAHEEEEIARGKEKTTAELDLCELANLVVAIGPKLTEAYEKQQRIITLTPGTFKEFSTINHSDSGNFTVLTFGRGDPEDCGLIGYDIAAKAVVELREKSYHLIFVSAPDDNQEAVKERLLQSGICNLQLTILNFSLQSKEKLKDCFREVDLCIMPYQTEGFGLNALTALSAGLPFLVSGNSSFGDALRTVPFGANFVVDSEDPKVWAEAIDGVSKKKRSLRLKEIEQLRTSYEEQFSWEKQCDLLVDRMWEEVHCAGLLKQSLRRILSLLVINNNTLTKELTTSVSDMGFRISDNIGSRNCMFHALSEQLESVRGIKIQHGQLRESLVQYLRKSPKMMESFKYFAYWDLGNPELKFYLRVSGGCKVGKMGLLRTCPHWVRPHTSKDYRYHKSVHLDHDRTVQLIIIKNPSALSKYHPVHASIVVYDITQRRSFAEAKELVDEFTQEARPGAFVALVGNKADLKSRREVSFKEAQLYADENNIVEIFMEVSALTGENVEDLFFEVAKRLTVPLSVISETLALGEKTLDLSRRNLDWDPWIYGIREFLHTRENFSLTNILSLNLSHNRLEKLPDIFLQLINLTCLYVNNNRLSSLPESIGCLKRLQELDLRNNQLKVLDVVRKLPDLRKLLVEGNPLTLVKIRRLIRHVDTTTRSISVDIAAVAPPEILAQGHSARLVYEEALRDGFVNVYRGRIVLVGQDRAGKTSLKKTLLGLPFDFKEQSTDGIEIEPSKFEIEVEQIKNWTPSCANKSSFSDCLECTTDIAKLLATKRYHMIVGDEKEGSEMKSVGAQHQEERRVESGEELHTKHAVADQVSVYEHPATKFPDRSEPLSEVHEGDNLSTKSKMAINATVLPIAVEKQADELLKNMIFKGEDADGAHIEKGSTITADVWDFAGQQVYYAAHPVFLSSRAVYIVVHNLNKPLNARAQPCVRQGTHEVPLENPNNETNLDNLLSWLVTVHNMRPAGEEMVETPNVLPYLRPPVFIVGTHADKPYEATKDVTSKILREISSKEYGKHVIRPFFYIDNTQGDKSFSRKVWNFFKFQRNPQAGQEGDNDGASADGIHALRARILEVLRKEPYMGEKIPVRWFNFEKVIEALVADNVYHTNTAHLQTYAKDVCFIEDDGQFHTMLNFYHDLGMIVKHRSTVILKAQWLINLFKKLITIPAFKKADPVHSKYWLELERSGVLKMELVDHVFSPLIQQGVHKGDILDMMEQFGLIAKYSPSLADVQYFVPCQLRSSPEELCKVEPSSTDPCPLYLHFLEGFVPHGLFTRLVSKSVAWCGASGLSQPPKLYQNGAWFVLEGRVIHDMIMICKKKFIKILLRQRIKTGALPVSNSTLAEVARSVRLFMESILEKISREFPYLSRMQHEFCVECPYCQQGGRKCTNHNQLSCTEEECIHLLELRQGQDLICMESMSNEVLTVPGQERWLLNQDLAPSVRRTLQVVPLRGHPAECDKTLKVALLASEWNSSMGGLSTINRHLAILMAKRNEVEVTLLVPQFACSEEEKRDAESHKIVIKEAERRPGFDALDWLSFPPKDLVIDVVLGHGAKLGRQAQIIRESHSCQWVQVVHTAPEELGMFKNYPRAIARGEEKTTAEVDLCKLANLVVAVGPKLTEAYSAYLQSCERQQDIMSLTPGTFKEFSTLNHASIDSEKFRVLTFGRGDPEDFGLKGYDIAAKAVAELKDNSYHLIFVGAPDGKQETVTETLLQNGISKRQLTVRTFLQSKQKLKDCFCEVNLCIMPSRTEGFGLTALEALSAGLPILVSGNSGFGDALRTVPPGKSFVVDSEDPKVWAEAIAVVRKKERSQRLKEIERLRTSYEGKFSWEKQCDLLVDKMWVKVHGAGLLERTIQNLQRMQLCASSVNNHTTLTEELTTIVSDKGFRISRNQGSGNCMFYALSEQLETVKGIKIQHGQLRQSLIQYLRENPKLPDGTDLCHFVHGHETWADYLTYMKEDGAWGDHLILCAAANCFKTCIHVFSSLHNDVVIRPNHPVEESKPLVLGHIHEVHYVSLQPIQG